MGCGSSSDMGSQPQPHSGGGGQRRLERLAQRQIMKLGVRILLDVATGGLAEAVFIPMDFADGLMAVGEVLDTVGTLSDAVKSTSQLSKIVGEAVQDGTITRAEAKEILDAGKDSYSTLQDVRKAIGQLGSRDKTVTGKEVVCQVKRVVHCSKCGAPGVNMRSHKKGHPNAKKHRW